VTRTVVTGVALMTVDDQRRVIERGWIAMDGALIAGLGPGIPPPALAGGAAEIDGRGRLVIPGLVSTHEHMVDGLLRGGIEQGRDLHDWLINVNFAGLSGYRPEDAELAVTLTTAEALAAGITTVCDNWGIDNGADRARTDACLDATLDVYRRAGIRAMVGLMFADRVPGHWAALTDANRCRVPTSTLDPTTLVEGTDAALARVAAAMERAAADDDDGRIAVFPAPELVQVVTPEALAAVAAMALAARAPLALHLCEGPADARMFTESGTSMGAIDWLDIQGVLGPRLLASHCVEVDDRDLRLLAAAGVKVAHVPTSNAAASQGIAPLARMLSAGICVGLGNDNTNLSERSLLAQMRMAVLLARASTGDPDAVTAEEAIEMATISGARALGVHEVIGSLEVGKRADLVLLDRRGSHWWPQHDLASALVWQARVSDVRRVWVDGRCVVEDGHPCFVDTAGLGPRVQAAALGVLQRAGLGAQRGRPWRSRSTPDAGRLGR